MIVNFDEQNKDDFAVAINNARDDLSIKMISSCGSVSLKARCSSLASRSSGQKDRFVPR